MGAAVAWGNDGGPALKGWLGIANKGVCDSDRSQRAAEDKYGCAGRLGQEWSSQPLGEIKNQGWRRGKSEQNPSLHLHILEDGQPGVQAPSGIPTHASGRLGGKGGPVGWGGVERPAVEPAV